MIILEPRNMHWLGKKEHAHLDKCAHGQVYLKIDDTVIVDEGKGDWTLTTTALYLLRTLEKSHTCESPLFENLIPCCGHAMFAIETEPGFVIVECFNGINFEVIHNDDGVNIIKDGQSVTISIESWRTAVVGFSKAVKSFHDTSDEKIVEDEDERAGLARFMEEWNTRHRAAASGTVGNGP